MEDILIAPSNTGANVATTHRVRSLARKHWLGLDDTPEHREAATAVRQGYFVTASENYKAATRMYENLTSPPRSSAPPPVLTRINRNIQLLLAYAALWEAFKHIYNAAAYTHFARHGAETEPVEQERDKMDRVLRDPILPATEMMQVGLLRNGETVTGAILRLCSRSSRELEKIAGESHDQTLTDMDAFMQGLVEGPWPSGEADTNALVDRNWKAWVVRPLDDSGLPINPDSPLDAAKYRSVLKWLCYQIHSNINFVGKSDDSLDDVILIIRAFCLLEPIIGILLAPTRKDAIFAL